MSDNKKKPGLERFVELFNRCKNPVETAIEDYDPDKYLDMAGDARVFEDEHNDKEMREVYKKNRNSNVRHLAEKENRYQKNMPATILDTVAAGGMILTNACYMAYCGIAEPLTLTYTSLMAGDAIKTAPRIYDPDTALDRKARWFFRAGVVIIPLVYLARQIHIKGKLDREDGFYVIPLIAANVAKVIADNIRHSNEKKIQNHLNKMIGPKETPDYTKHLPKYNK